MKPRTRRRLKTVLIISAILLALAAAAFLCCKYVLKCGSGPDIAEGSSFAIRFFDAGEGDSALVECDGHYMLIDGGNPSDSSFLYAYLDQRNIGYIDYVVCTHAHTDHVGGLAGALNRAEVGTTLAPVTEYDSRAFNSFIKYLEAQGKGITVPPAGSVFELGSAKVTILGPVDMALAKDELNNSSIVLRIVYGSTSFLFTGDAEAAEELSIIDSGRKMRSTLLKVGHHGSDSSSTAEFLKAVKPKIAVISVGADNQYGHPDTAVLSRLEAYTGLIYRTDLQGMITCTSDGKTVSVTTER